MIAACPLVGGKSLKGPSDRIMTQMGLEGTMRPFAFETILCVMMKMSPLQTRTRCRLVAATRS
jgi:hypothetical protein